MIELGGMYRDEITGFSGTATAVTRHLNNEVTQVRVEGKTGQLEPKERWFADHRLQLVPEKDMGFSKLDRIDVS